MIKTKASKFVTGIVGFVIALALVAGVAAPTADAAALTAGQVSAIISLLQSFGADAATIANVQASLTGSAPVVPSTPSLGYKFNKDLSSGMTDADVKQLQLVLNMSADTMVSASGAGSPGNESMYFGAKTVAAVKKFQAKSGVSATGYVGPLTRGILNSSAVAIPGQPGTGNNPGQGQGNTGGLTVSAPTQPASSLAPQSAARVPFTKVTLTAGSSDVTVNSITVEKAGLGDNAVFSGVVLVNESTGQQIGIAKTLNSNSQAMVGEPWTIKAGTSQTVVVAGNMASSLSSYAGQVVGLRVVQVNTSATVAGALPIVGAMHTINATLSLGSATVRVSSFDPQTSSSQNIGTTGFRFAGFQATAGSAEKVRLWSVRFNQSGSASSNDLANVVVNVDGTDYPTTLSSDGKYYTALFGSGVVLDKGFSKDVYVKADIIGSGSASRTVKFDLYKNTDVYLTGETYGYGITPSPSSTGSASNATSEFTTTNPWFDGSQITISAGSITTISKATSIAAQNIAVNVPNQPLGGYEIDLKGEPISVQSTIFHFTSSAAAGSDLLTNVTLVNQNGTVIAGPVDAVAEAGTNQKVTFTDTITYPVGKQIYTLRGKVDADIANGRTITASTTPSSDWSNITGQTTGNTISLSSLSSAVAMNAMTVKTAALAVTVSTDPAAQTMVAGGQLATFANYQFDATQSGEDVRFSTLGLTLGGSGTVTKLTACQLFDGGTALNTGSNVVNPSAAASTFTLDQSLTIPKGTIKTLTLKCNVASDATGTFQWGITSTQTGNITVTGVTSSQSVTATGSTYAGQLQTVGSGSLAVSKDSSSPSYQIVASGAQNVTIGVLKLRAGNEAVNLTRLGLTLTNSASSSAADLVNVKIFQGATQVGTVTFTGSGTTATSTDLAGVVLPKDTDATLTLKADLAEVGTSKLGTQGHLIAVDYSYADATGASSGSSITPTGSTAFDGVRLFKSYPTFATLSLPSTVLVSGTTADLYRFSVTANSAGAVGIYKFTVNVATSSTPSGTSSTTVTNLKVFAYTDAGFSSPVSGFTTPGQLNDTVAGLVSSGNNDILMTGSTQSYDFLQIPQGTTYYFRVVADITQTGAATGGSVVTNIQGDAAYPALASFMGQAADIDGDTNDDFIWSPNATGTSATTANDWTNGYFLPGLPSDNSDNKTISK